jgi:hypothetical protein
MRRLTLFSSWLLESGDNYLDARRTENCTVLGIKGKGTLALQYMEFDDAKGLAGVLGIVLQETTAEHPPAGQSRKNLLARLAI